MVDPRLSIRLWALLCVVVALVFLSYAGVSVATSGGDIVMPLDDAYIHFQYAKQMVNGEPYVYVPGGEPTSGATSFIYPYVLAIGYAVGFDGLSLGLWAMGIGALSLLAASWLVVRLIGLRDQNGYLAAILAFAFPLTGAISWHFMSGMETGLVTLFVLATVYTLARDDPRGFAFAGTLLVLGRPELGLLSLLGVALMVWRHRAEQQKLIWVVFPVLAFGVQPFVNLLLTGSLSASGNNAKSLLAMVPFHLEVVAERIFDNFTRMWGEFATGTNGNYLPVIVPLLALVGWTATLVRREHRGFAVLLLLAFVAITGAISTLDTAFWHFKRYQMPLMALMMPLAGWGLVAIHMWAVRRLGVISGLRTENALALVAMVILLLALPTWVEFQRLYRVNVGNIAAQPLPMARWLQANTPDDALVAVHDVGMMAYIGERRTLDMVGLTTPGAADAWRNGPGAVAEFIMSHDPLPDYVAAYTTARGLNYLEDTPIYGELLAGFAAEYAPEDNVAVGAEFQGIYPVDVSGGPQFAQLTGTGYFLAELLSNNVINDMVNAAYIQSETAHDYVWSNAGPTDGFATEVYAFEYPDCSDLCQVVDGGRLINGEEAFTVNVTPGDDAILVTRVHPVYAGTIDIYVDSEYLDTRWIPSIPGRWLDLPTLIPADRIEGDEMRVRIVADVAGGFYMPYMHTIYGGMYTPPGQNMPGVLAQDATYQDGTFTVSTRMRRDNDQLAVTLFYVTGGTATGDYRVFIHVYDGPDAPPVAQYDGYPGGSLPPGNWLPGTLIETVAVDLSNLPSGRYSVALGFYDPQTGERLLPEPVDGSSARIDDAGLRLFLGDVEIP